MTFLDGLAWTSLVLAAIPAVMVLVNLLFYRPPRPVERRAAHGDDGDPSRPAISVLIPARDEENTIRGSVEAALTSRGVDLEVVVMDDGSRDRTASIVETLAARDPRVRSVTAPSLPAGWCGKQHACHRLTAAARHDILVFLDADVRLVPDGLVRMHSDLDRRRLDLSSGVPRQTTVGWMEKLVVPLIHFVLLGFLPMAGMRWTRWPAFAAGCGQLFMTRRGAYGSVGGHGAIRDSRHDGLRLPRAYRQAGFRTDLVDATDLARCRMYRSADAVWHGFAKNADEGMATPKAIVPWTLLLLGGQVLPIVLVASSSFRVAIGACALAWGTRAVLAARFRQSWLGVLLHPVGVAIVVAIQWWSLIGRMRGRTVRWKGRAPSSKPEATAVNPSKASLEGGQ